MTTAMLILVGVIAACLVGMLVEMLLADREPSCRPLPRRDEPPWGDEPLPQVVPAGDPVRWDVERYLRVESGRGGDDGADERGEWRI